MTYTGDEDVVTVDLIGCARCHGDGHGQLKFKKLTYPVVYPGNDDLCLTYWALCPTNGEPIMMTFVESNEHQGAEQ